MPTLTASTTASTNYARELHRGAQTSETAIRNAAKERSEQCARLRACILKELTFRVKEGPPERIWIPLREPVVDGSPENEWRDGEACCSPFLSAGAEFTATVIKAGIDEQGRSYVVIGVSVEQGISLPGAYDVYLRPKYEYQLFLERIKVVGGLD